MSGIEFLRSCEFRSVLQGDQVTSWSPNAGRRPLCLRPTRGSKAVQIRWPASETYRLGLLDDLTASVRPPIESLSHCLRCHPLYQIGKDIARPSGRDDDPPAFRLEFDARALSQPGPLCDGL